MKIWKYKVSLKNHDLPALLIMYGWATWYFFSSNGLGQHEQTMAFIAPMYYIMLGLLVLYLVKTLSIEKLDKGADAASPKPSAGLLAEWWRSHRRMAGFIALLVLYLLTMPRLGFILSTILYLALTTVWLGNRNRLQIVCVPVCSALVLYFLFEKVFMIRLPSGLL